MKTLLRVFYVLALFSAGCWLAVRIIILANQPPAPPAPAGPRRLAPEASPVAAIEDWLRDTRHQARHFHQTMHHDFPRPETLSACLSCHHPLPHRRDRARRSFNNQHSRFMTCMVCHLAPEQRARASFRWSSFDVELPLEGSLPYGVHRDAAGRLSGQDNLVTRIVPVLAQGGKELAIFTSYMDDEHLDFRRARARGAADTLAFRRKAEALVGAPALGCRDCHSKGGAMPWAALGFDPARVEELANSSAVEMVEAGEFHFTPIE
jgi:hypothetical protein